MPQVEIPFAYDLLYMLRGAYLLLLIFGGTILVGKYHPRWIKESYRATPLDISVGTFMIYDFVLSLAWISFEIAGLRYNDFHSMLYTLSFATLPPFLIFISYTLHFEELPDKKYYLFFLASLSIPLLFIFTKWEWLYYMLVVYCVAVGIALALQHHFWENRQRQRIKENYSDLENRGTHWWSQLMVPLIFQMLLICLCRIVNNVWLYNFFYVVSIIIWSILIYCTNHHRRSILTEGNDEPQAPEAAPASQQEPQQSPKKLSEETIQLITQKIQETEAQKLYLQPDVDAQTYTQYIGTNRTYLSRYLHHEKGMNFYQYINHLRMSEAIEMLVHEEKTIEEISYQCGYNNPRTFRQIFNDHFGCSPSEYRETHKRENSIL